MEELYQERYKTGKTGVTIGILIISLSVLLVSFCIVFGLTDVLRIAIVLLFFCGGGGYILLRNYREMLLYHDRIEVSGLLSGMITEVRYDNIKHIGFLRGHLEYASRLGRGYSDGGEVRDLIILLNDGGREVFGSEEYDYLPEVCAFIQERIGHT
jgi:hypothetical protein